MAKTHLKKYLVFILFVLIAPNLTAAINQDSTRINQIKSIADTVGKELVPDKRTDIFQVEISTTEPLSVELETTLPAAEGKLRSAFSKAGLNVAVKTRVLPLAVPGSKNYGVVRLSVSNNRKVPGNASEMVTQLLLGTPVQILKKQHGYALVRSPDKYISWVDNGAIAEMDTTEFAAWEKATKLIYIADYGFSYSEPDPNSLRVSDLVKGNIVRLLEKNKGFYKIGYPDGRTAYIPVKEAEDFKRWMAGANPGADQILATAKTLMGVPYLWGGTSVKGVDCSGFTKTSYFLNGIILPRDASQQALVGEPVDIYEADTVNLAKCLKNLKAGDLLFFSGGKGKSLHPKVTHTAIYISNGVFIQAAGMVRINSMVPTAGNYADFQSRTLVSARRMLTAVGKPEITRVDKHPYYNNP